MAIAAVIGAVILLYPSRREPSTDTTPDAAMSGTSGESVERYDALGDSITYGDMLGFRVDGQGRPTKAVTTFQGWPALLGHLLAESSGARIEVVNRGFPGDRVDKSRAERLRDLLDEDTEGRRALLLIGTNDSNDFNPTPSGLGCDGRACRNTYKGMMQSVIEDLGDAGYATIYVASLPPVWGSRLDVVYEDPLDLQSAPRNARIVEYNRVIAEGLMPMPGVRPGPDFYRCFLGTGVNRFSLFRDTLHPNKLGYVFMAALWRDAITSAGNAAAEDGCESPVYIVESLDPYVHGHKQTLVEAGDPYYTDESFVVEAVPDELANGIWILQPNAGRDNGDDEFLSFDVGPRPVTVYIAFDPAGSPPSSSSHEFSAIELPTSLIVSDPAVESLELVHALDVTGNVRIGGTRSGDPDAGAAAYVAIVVP